MNVIRRHGWEIPERLATPEHLVFSRRSFIVGGATALALAPRTAGAQRVTDLPDPTADLYPAKRSEVYAIDRPITDEKINDTTIIFTNSGLGEASRRAGPGVTVRPWTVKIDGMVEKRWSSASTTSPEKDDARGATLSPSLRRRLGDYDRLEWISLAELVDLAQPLGSAKLCAWKPS